MESEGRKAVTEIAKGVCAASLFTLAAVLLFALVIKLFSLGGEVISPVNQVIRHACVFAGCFLCLRPRRAAFKGAGCGALTALVTWILFSAIAGEFSFGLGFLLDVLFGAVAGALSGVIVTVARGRS